jgi:hypothetical protein
MDSGGAPSSGSMWIARAPVRVFTLAEANEAIPSLTARLDRLRHLRNVIRRNRKLLGSLWRRLGLDEPVLGAICETQGAADAAVEEYGSVLHEVATMGVVLHALDPGLVDFLAESREGRIYLCWRAGESSIGFWHGPGEGFVCRRPISSLEVSH